MIHDKYTVHGYEVRLVSGYDIVCINRNGKEMKSVPKDAKDHPKWRDFVEERKNHRKWVTRMKHKVVKLMQNRQWLTPSAFMEKENIGLAELKKVELADLYDPIKGMYVRAKSGTETWDGFIDGCGDKFLKVGGKPAYCVFFLHPVEISNLHEVQIEAIKHMHVQHIQQLFKPVFKLSRQEIDHDRIERYVGVVVKKYQFAKISSETGWRCPRNAELGRVIRKEIGNIAVVLECSTYVHVQDTFELGHAKFVSIKEGEMQPLLAENVPEMETSELLWEIEQLVTPCRVDDKMSEEMTAFRQQMANIYLSAMCIDRAEVMGNSIKVYGTWGIYGVSLVTGMSFWWKTKNYLCIQPKEYENNSGAKDKGQHEGFAFGEDALDPTLALAMSKVYLLAHDADQYVDSVVDNQIHPCNGRSKSGETLQEIELQYKEKQLRDAKKW